MPPIVRRGVRAVRPVGAWGLAVRSKRFDFFLKLHRAGVDIVTVQPERFGNLLGGFGWWQGGESGAQGIVETLEHQHAATLAKQGAIGAGGKRLDARVARQRAEGKLVMSAMVQKPPA